MTADIVVKTEEKDEDAVNKHLNDKELGNEANHMKCSGFENVDDANSSHSDSYAQYDDTNDSEIENCDEVSDYGYDDLKLQELLREFDLEILFTVLKLSDITYQSLKFVTENDINAAIRSIAYRAEFREKLFAWRRDKLGLNDFSVLPPAKKTSISLSENNILSTRRTRRLSEPETSVAKKARISNQYSPTLETSKRGVPAPPSQEPETSGPSRNRLKHHTSSKKRARCRICPRVRNANTHTVECDECKKKVCPQHRFIICEICEAL